MTILARPDSIFTPPTACCKLVRQEQVDKHNLLKVPLGSDAEEESFPWDLL